MSQNQLMEVLLKSTASCRFGDNSLEATHTAADPHNRCGWLPHQAAILQTETTVDERTAIALCCG
jgi:hypothetical protein